jgi:hypothetical protein
VNIEIADSENMHYKYGMTYLTPRHRQELIKAIEAHCAITKQKPETLCRNATGSPTCWNRLQEGRLIDPTKIKIEREMERTRPTRSKRGAR